MTTALLAARSNRVAAEPSPRSVVDHARIICAACDALNQSNEEHVRKIIELGRAWQHAREELGYGGYGKLFANNGRRVRGFNPDRAERLRKIASNRVLSNSAHWRKFPAVERVLFELAKLADEVLIAALADGRIHPQMTAKDVEAIKATLKQSSQLLYQLTSALEKVEPALSLNTLIPQLTQFWLTGTHLMAYNDQIGLQVPMVTDFRGAVSRKLLKLLKLASFDADIKITPQDGGVLVSDAVSARLSIKLDLHAPNFIFAMPKRKQKRSDPQTIAALVDAIEHCLISVGRDTSTIEQLGVTLERQGMGITLYATDGASIARTCISCDPGIAKRTILPTKFCEEMVRIYRDLGDKSQAHFELGVLGTTRYGLFFADEVTLYSRILESRNPLNLQGTVAHHLPAGFESQLVDMPERLRKALDLHSLLCTEPRRLTTLTVNQGTLRLRSQNDEGVEADEILPLLGHPDVAVRVQPKLLMRAIGFDQMLIRPEVLIMSRPGGLYLVSLSPVGEER